MIDDKNPTPLSLSEAVKQAITGYFEEHDLYAAALCYGIFILISGKPGRFVSDDNVPFNLCINYLFVHPDKIKLTWMMSALTPEGQGHDVAVFATREEAILWIKENIKFNFTLQTEIYTVENARKWGVPIPPEYLKKYKKVRIPEIKRQLAEIESGKDFCPESAETVQEEIANLNQELAFLEGGQ